MEAGGEQLPAAERQRADAVVAKVSERTALVGGHTVVALAGATGSGKSSLFNALVGTPVATVGVRRPTTSTPTAAIWGDEPVGDLLDWLGVGARHLVATDPEAEPGGGRRGGPVGSLDGLVLLDLPDFDSREIGHRTEAERVLELVDLFVWVTDPQKYADARLHDDYVAALATHEAVTMVVLNQADRLTAAEVAQCRADLVRLMERDGVPRATVLATSVTTGDGLDELHQRLANAVAGRTMTRARLAGDVRAAAGCAAPGTSPRASRPSTTRPAASCSTPWPAAPACRPWSRPSSATTGWRPPRAPAGRSPGGCSGCVPARCAGCGSTVATCGSPTPTCAPCSAARPCRRRARPPAPRSTSPPVDWPTGPARSLPHPWADAVERAADPPGPALGDALDRAVVGTSLLARVPIWWRVVGLAQLVLAAAAVVGFLWLALYVIVGWAQLDQVIGDPPTLGVVPVPLVLLVVGLLGGLLLALVSRWLARVGGRRRGRVMDARLRASIDGVARAEIVQPVERVLERHAATRLALSRAADV